MKTYIIAARNSVGVVAYVHDDNGACIMCTDEEHTNEVLKNLKEKGAEWADFEVFQLVPASAKLCEC